MGLFKFLIGGYAANLASNKLNPPTVVPSGDYEIRGIKAKGASKYVVRYAKKGSNTTHMTTIGRATTGFSRGGARFKVYW